MTAVGNMPGLTSPISQCLDRISFGRDLRLCNIFNPFENAVSYQDR